MGKQEKHEDFLPATEVAGILETTVLSVLMHIKRRHLVGREIDGQWYIDRVSLENFRAISPEGVKPDLCRSGCPVKGGCVSCD